MRHLPPAARAAVDQALQASPGGAVAFDADGTLWRGDIGEELLRLLAAEDRLPRHRGRRGIYAEYERRVARDPADAYAFAVEVMADLPEAELAAWSDDFFARRFEGRLFLWVRPLLDELLRRGAGVWIVSASPRWPVEAAARALGVPAARVIGVGCEVRGGLLTGEVQRPVPCGEGKVHWLRARGVRPALAFGNGELDLPMLAYAARAIVVGPHGEDTALCRAARREAWPILRC